MKTCPDCKLEFPEDLIQEAFVDGGYVSLCGVCTVGRIRKAHGDDNYLPRGERARGLYEAAKAIHVKAGRNP
jgi:hypothetical protein